MFLNVAHEHAVHYPFPAFWFGAIAFGVFVLLAVVTWSYRDVANRHEHKVSKDSKGHH